MHSGEHCPKGTGNFCNSSRRRKGKRNVCLYWCLQNTNIRNQQNISYCTHQIIMKLNEENIPCLSMALTKQSLQRDVFRKDTLDLLLYVHKGTGVRNVDQFLRCKPCFHILENCSLYSSEFTSTEVCWYIFQVVFLSLKSRLISLMTQPSRKYYGLQKEVWRLFSL